jgi:hypothetical protein
MLKAIDVAEEHALYFSSIEQHLIGQTTTG